MSAYFTTHHFSPRFAAAHDKSSDSAQSPVTAVTAPTPSVVAAQHHGVTTVPDPTAPHPHNGIDALARFLHSFNVHYGHNGAAQGSHDIVHPHFDLVETKTSYAVYGELPGLDNDAVNVEVNDHLFTVTVSGSLERPVPPGAEEAVSNVGVVHKDAAGAPAAEEKKDEGEPSKSSEEAPQKEEVSEADRHWHVTERRVGQFRRAFQFPIELVDMSAVKAGIQAGLLTIVVPKKLTPEVKKKLAEARKVEVVAADVRAQFMGALSP